MRTHQTIGRCIGSSLALVFAAFAMIGSANATSANTDISDIWWNPKKNGNGYQLVNTGTFVFATAFVYGPDRKPTWMIASLDRTAATANAITYSGPLYVTTGPYFGGPYDPATLTVREAGTMKFILTGISLGELSYTIDGVSVTEPVERQPLTLDDYNGAFAVLFTNTNTGCPTNSPTTGLAGLNIVQNATEMSQTWTYSDGSCTYRGKYSQLGRMGTFVADSGSCTTGVVPTSMATFQMTNEPGLFMARFDTTISTGCRQSGQLVGLLPF